MEENNIERGIIGVVSYISDDGIFGDIIANGEEYSFHKSCLTSQINVGDEVIFDAMYSNFVLFAFKVEKHEELEKPITRVKEK